MAAIPQTPAHPHQLLALSTLATEYFVAIDGTPYRLFTAEQLPILGVHTVMTKRRRIDELWDKGSTLTADEAVELGHDIAGVVEHVLQAPADVRAKLTDLQRFEIVMAFRTLPSASPATGASTVARTSRATGASSPRSSRGSIPARHRGTGSRKRPSRSSGRR